MYIAYKFQIYQTQVGSTAVRLRLAHYTSWVKRWSKAMDFLQTIFQSNIFLLCIFEIKSYKKKLQNLTKTYDPVVTKSKGMLKTPEFDITYAISRIA